MSKINHNISEMRLVNGFCLWVFLVEFPRTKKRIQHVSNNVIENCPSYETAMDFPPISITRLYMLYRRSSARTEALTDQNMPDIIGVGITWSSASSFHHVLWKPHENTEVVLCFTSKQNMHASLCRWCHMDVREVHQWFRCFSRQYEINQHVL